MDMVKVVRIGKQEKWNGSGTYSVFCKIEWREKDDGKHALSITGVEGPTFSGGCYGACGQIVTHLTPDHMCEYAPGWDKNMLRLFLAIWDRYHLNDMNVCTPVQALALEVLSGEYSGDTTNHCYESRSILRKVNAYHSVYNGKPSRYGHAWYYEDVPEDVIHWLFNLPDTDIQPAWV